MRERALEWLSALVKPLPDADVRVGVGAAAVFNSVGVAIGLLIFGSRAGATLWPAYLSIAEGGALFALVLSGKPRRVPSWLFAVNAAFVSFALWFFYAKQIPEPSFSVNFQAVKLGTIVASLLAPGFYPGIAAVAIHVGTAVTQIAVLSPDLRARMSENEPWVLLVYGIAGVLILIHRLRVRQIERTALQARHEAESTRRLAQAFLELRDQINTPLQSIEIATSLLEKDRKAGGAIVEPLRESCERLREISRALKRYDGDLQWKSVRGGLSDG